MPLTDKIPQLRQECHLYDMDTMLLPDVICHGTGPKVTGYEDCGSHGPQTLIENWFYSVIILYIRAELCTRNKTLTIHMFLIIFSATSVHRVVMWRL